MTTTTEHGYIISSPCEPEGRMTTMTTEHGYIISSPCEPEGSGELKILVYTYTLNSCLPFGVVLVLGSTALLKFKITVCLTWLSLPVKQGSLMRIYY